MEKENQKNKHIGVRVTPETKNEIDIIINVLNELREPNEPKYNYSYAYDFLIDYYITHPNFKLYIQEQKLNKQVEDLTKQKELIEFELNKLETELKEVRNQINNISLDEYNTTEQQIILTKPIKQAISTIKNNCKQRDIFNFEDIPDKMFISVASTFKVDKHKLKQATKQEFNK